MNKEGIDNNDFKDFMSSVFRYKYIILFFILISFIFSQIYLVPKFKDDEFRSSIGVSKINSDKINYYYNTIETINNQIKIFYDSKDDFFTKNANNIIGKSNFELPPEVNKFSIFLEENINKDIFGNTLIFDFKELIINYSKIKQTNKKIFFTIDNYSDTQKYLLETENSIRKKTLYDSFYVTLVHNLDQEKYIDLLSSSVIYANKELNSSLIRNIENMSIETTKSLNDRLHLMKKDIRADKEFVNLYFKKVISHIDFHIDLAKTLDIENIMINNDDYWNFVTLVGNNSPNIAGLYEKLNMDECFRKIDELPRFVNFSLGIEILYKYKNSFLETQPLISNCYDNKIKEFENHFKAFNNYIENINKEFSLAFVENTFFNLQEELNSYYYYSGNILFKILPFIIALISFVFILFIILLILNYRKIFFIK